MSVTVFVTHLPLTLPAEQTISYGHKVHLFLHCTRAHKRWLGSGHAFLDAMGCFDWCVLVTKVWVWSLGDQTAFREA